MLVCSLGDLLLDVVVRTGGWSGPDAEGNAETRVGAGGQAANVAAWAVALGVEARFVGKRSADAAGEIATRELAGRGVEVLGPVERGPARVLVHDASGRLEVYEELAAQLREEVPLLGLVVRDTSAYLDLGPPELVERVAADYAAALLALGHARLQLVGHGFGGVLAAELARHLAEAGAYVERLVVAGCDPRPGPVTEEPSGRLAGHSLEAAGHHELLPFAVDVVVVEAVEAEPEPAVLDAWEELCIGELTILRVPGRDGELLQGEAATRVAELLRQAPASVGAAR